MLPKLRFDLGIERERRASPVPGAGRIRVAIIGAGLSGLWTAIKLRRAGFEVEIIEQASGIGGVWHANTYPDCGVDTHPYQYEFAEAPFQGWRHGYAGREEVLGYVRWLAERSGVQEAIRLDTRVLAARWDGGSQRWLIDIEHAQRGRERIAAQILIAATGALSQPKAPAIAGLERFGGACFHTARWRHDIALDGKRIGLVGNGSSGVQVAKALAARGRLTVFQRSPAWIAPRRAAGSNGAIDGALRTLRAHWPAFAAWHRLRLCWELGDRNYPTLVRDQNWHGEGSVNAANDAVRHDLTAYVRSQLGEREDLLAKLIPSYPPFVKRMVVDNDYYRTLARPDVTLVTEPITAATQAGLVTGNGTEHTLDVIVFATGFHGTRFLWPLDIRGQDGRNLADAAGEELRAYLGLALPGLPNFFLLHGPNSGAGHGGSATFLSDCQSDQILACLTHLVEGGFDELECRSDACDAYNARLDHDLAQMVWAHPGVASRFRNAQGRIVTNHPWTWQRYWKLTRRLDRQAFDWRRAGRSSGAGRGADIVHALQDKASSC
jgi:4-hydroxyacetophenone monooxygenase